MNKVFDHTNEALSIMLFRYLSGTRDVEEMKRQRINYLTFLKQFSCLLPKRPPRFPRSLDPSERNVILD